jgi:hypothetical protein
VPLAIVEQGRVRDPGSALPKVKHEMQAAVVELECGIVHLVLMSHEVNETTGGKGPDAQLNPEPGEEQTLSTKKPEPPVFEGISERAQPLP